MAVFSQYFTIKTDKPMLDYKTGDEICFYIFPRRNNGGCDLCDRIEYVIRTDAGDVVEGVVPCNPEQFATVKYVAKAPGFVCITAKAQNDPDSFSFYDIAPGDAVDDNIFEQTHASVGVDVDKITYSQKIPDDFDAYWDSVKALVDAHTPRLLTSDQYFTKIPDDILCLDVRVSTPQGRPASGFLCIPKKAGKYPIVMSFIGYSLSGATPRWDRNCICFCVNPHGIENGFSNSAMNTKYKATLSGFGYNEEENKKPKTCYWHNMIIRNLCALKYAKSLDAWDGKNVICRGGSMAAFQSVLVAAHDDSVTFLDISVPGMCDTTFTDFLRKGKTRRLQGEGWMYFDTVANAMRVKCPTNLLVRLGDQTCGPRGIMALYNAFNCKKKATFVQSGVHSQRPFEMREQILSLDPENPQGITLGKYKHYSGKTVEVIGLADKQEKELFLTDTGPHFAIKSFSAYEQPLKNVIYKEEGSDKLLSLCETKWFDSFVENGKFIARRFTPVK